MSPPNEVSRPTTVQLARASRPSANVPTTEDMVETPEELEKWSAIADRLVVCNRLIRELFLTADSAARRHQKWHRELTKLAAVCGTGAVLFAVLQLAYPRHLLGGNTLAIVEVVAIIAAFVAVVVGLISGRQRWWLLERHRAERLRLAKFRFLIDPLTWSTDQTIAEQKVSDLRAEVEIIRDLTPLKFREWTDDEGMRRELPLPQVQSLVGMLDQMVEYYRTKRLLFQRDVFHDRANRHERFDLFTRRLGPILFLLSVFAVLIHFTIARFHGEDRLHTISTVLIVLAVGLPVLGAGIRTFRAAYEFARNTSRYRAKAVALDRLDQVLHLETEPWPKLRKLWYSEELLEFEHHEWCRLMIEAEWLP